MYVLKDLLCCEPVPDTAQYARCGIGLIQCEDGTTDIGCTLLVLHDNKGEVDYVLCDVNSGGYLSTFYDDVSLAGTIAAPSRQGVALLSSDQALESAVDEAYSRLESNGRLACIRARWFGTGERIGEGSVVRAAQ